MAFPTFSAMRAVKGSGLTPTQVLVFWALCIFANTDAEAWPSVESIQALTRIKSDRTVQEALKALRAFGAIEQIEDATTRSRTYRLHPDKIPGGQQLLGTPQEMRGSEGTPASPAGPPAANAPTPATAAGTPATAAPDRTMEQTTERATEQTIQGPPKLKLVHPDPAGADRYDEAARLWGEVGHRAIGRRPSHGPDRKSKVGRQLEKLVRKDAELVLDAIRYVVEGTGKHADWLRDEYRPSLETVLRHAEEYAGRLRDHDPEAPPPKGEYVRGEHPGIPAMTEAEEDAARARWAAKGVR